MRWRSEVIAFADAMEKELKENDKKGGWSECDPEWLVKRIADERGELARALKAKPTSEKTRAHVLSEAADVANFAMMVADVMEALPQDRLASSHCEGHCLDPDEIVCSNCYDRHMATARENASQRSARETTDRLVQFVKDKAGAAFVRGEDQAAQFLRKLVEELEAFAKKAA